MPQHQLAFFLGLDDGGHRQIEVILLERRGVGVYGGGSEAANALAASAIVAAPHDATGKFARQLPLRPAYVSELLQS